jgi:sec-independent protein translocase protein TatC
MVTFAAVVTPSSDPFSMLALAVPLLIFYEASIIIGKMLGK